MGCERVEFCLPVLPPWTEGTTRPTLSVPTEKETVLDTRRLLPRELSFEIGKREFQLPRHDVDGRYRPRDRRVEIFLVGADPLVAAFRSAILP